MPIGSVLTDNVATPEAFRAAVPSIVVPFQKVTVLVGIVPRGLKPPPSPAVRGARLAVPFTLAVNISG